MTLDLDDEDDRRLAQELARRADVLLENFREGALLAAGWTTSACARTNPGVVYCSITGFGSGAGARTCRGYDFLVQALGGLMSITGDPAGEPTKAGVALVDVLTAKDATIGILAALAARDRTGVGQRVEVNLLSSLLGSLANQASAYFTTGVPPRRRGNQHPSIAPYETLRCKDDGHRGRLRQRPASSSVSPRSSVRRELAADKRFATNAGRVQNRAALVRELESALALAPAAVWAERLTAVSVPAGRVGTIAHGLRPRRVPRPGADRRGGGRSAAPGPPPGDLLGRLP